MVRARLTYQSVGDRWEALPVDGGFDDVVEVGRGVRLLVSGGVTVGFTVDVDGDLGSRLVDLGRYVVVESIESSFIEPPSGDEGTEVELESAAATVPARRERVSVAVAAPPPARRGSSVRLEPTTSGIKVGIAARWWFRLWGMWFTIVRGDGLVLADLPVPRGGRVELVPNAVPIRLDDLNGLLHRGPRTLRRIGVAVAAVVIAVVVLVSTATGSDGAMAPTTTASLAPLTVTPSTSAPTTPPASTTPPTAPPVPTRVPASQFVSDGGTIGLDLTIGTPTASPGDRLGLELALDSSGLNRWGPADADQVQSMLSCRSSLGTYREVPPQDAYRSDFAVLLQPTTGGEARLVDVVTHDLVLAGAMVEGCPDVTTDAPAQYMVYQRTFYETFEAEVGIPADLPPGEYAVRITIQGVAWATEDQIVIEIV